MDKGKFKGIEIKPVKLPEEAPYFGANAYQVVVAVEFDDGTARQVGALAKIDENCEELGELFMSIGREIKRQPKQHRQETRPQIRAIK